VIINFNSVYKVKRDAIYQNLIKVMLNFKEIYFGFISCWIYIFIFYFTSDSQSAFCSIECNANCEWNPL